MNEELACENARRMRIANELVVLPPQISFSRRFCERCGLVHDVPDDFVGRESWEVHRSECTIPRFEMGEGKCEERVEGREMVDEGKGGFECALDEDSGVLVDRDNMEWDMV
ncbi:hypothetical protein WAI453_004420 [Rhynchosporium graminicola]